MRWTLLVPSVALIVGCLATAEQVETGTTAGDGPPEVWDLGTSMLWISEGEAVTFTAFVEDPDGPDDVVEVRLVGEAEQDYGLLEPNGSGRWALTLSWADLHAVAPIEFEGEDTRVFVARATDAAGGTGTASTMLNLTCAAINPAACDGHCIDLDVETCP